MLRCLCHHSFYQIKLLNTLPCINLLTPHLFLNVLIKISQIWVVLFKFDFTACSCKSCFAWSIHGRWWSFSPSHISFCQRWPVRDNHSLSTFFPKSHQNILSSSGSYYQLLLSLVKLVYLGKDPEGLYLVKLGSGEVYIMVRWSGEGQVKVKSQQFSDKSLPLVDLTLFLAQNIWQIVFLVWCHLGFSGTQQTFTTSSRIWEWRQRCTEATETPSRTVRSGGGQSGHTSHSLQNTL